MLSCKKSTTADRCGGNPFTYIHPDIIQTNILNRLDGATLASTSCASSQLRSLCSDDRIWRDICNSTWPSTADPRVVRAISAFPSGHRSFYSDSFLSASQQLPEETRLSGTSELIFAVDIYYRGQVVYSKVLETRSTSDWSLKLPYIRLKFEGDCRRPMSLLQEHLRVSWIVIDTNNKQAVNISRQAAMESWRIRRDGTTMLHDGGKPRNWFLWPWLSPAARNRGELHVKEVEMHVEDIDGNILGETESVGILRAAMEGERRRMEGKMEKHDYENFLRIYMYNS